MQLTNIILSAIALPFLANAGPLDTTSNRLAKRDNPMTVDTFKGNSPVGKSTTVDDAKKGTVVTHSLDCGTITATNVKNFPATCNFMLPATMPAGTFTGTPAGGFYSISVPGSCAGAVTQVGVFIQATGAGDIGESPNLSRCDGSTSGTDNINLCVSGTSLVAC